MANTRRCRALIAGASLLASAQLADAQGIARARNDTLFFVTTEESATQSGAPMGGAAQYINSRGRLVLVFLGGDSARVWHDTVIATTRSTRGGDRAMPNAPTTPVTIRFLPNGKVDPPWRPQGPTAAAMGDVSGPWEFELPRPIQVLTAGQTWADTVDRKLGASMPVSVKSVTTYKVAGDSTFAGIPVIVIEVRSESRNESAIANMKTSGTTQGTGRILFAPSLGMVVSRVSQGEGKSQMTAPSMTVDVSTRSKSTFVLVR